MKFMQRKQEAQRRLELQAFAPSSGAANAATSSSQATLVDQNAVTFVDAPLAVNHLLGRRQFGSVVRVAPPTIHAVPGFVPHPLAAGVSDDEDGNNGKAQKADEGRVGRKHRRDDNGQNAVDDGEQEDRRRRRGGGERDDRRFYVEDGQRNPPMPKRLERDMKRRRKEPRHGDDDHDEAAMLMEQF